MAKARATRAPRLSRLAPLEAAYEDARGALSPAIPMTVSEWADKYRVLAPDESEPGPWRTSRTPYLKDIMDELSSTSPTERVVFMKGAQIGGTECGNNWIGYLIHHSPGRILAVMPTTEMAKRNSKTRIEPLIASSPVLRSRVQPPRSADTSNTILAKEFPGGVLVMTGANSAVGLRSMPARFLFLDEVDGYPGDAGGEGDPVALATRATLTFKGKLKKFLCSTPLMKGTSRIERAFEESDQRYYFVPCPSCGKMQRLEWSGVVWPTGKPQLAAYECISCEVEIPHHRKLGMMDPAGGAEFRATAKGDGKTVGFHVSSLYSPWISWGDIAVEFVKAGRDPTLLKPWANTKLAETFDDTQAEAIDTEGLMHRREDWGDGVPRGIGVITVGMDTQDDRIELEVVGWGRDEESWSLDYRIFYGDPSTKELWATVDEYLLARWRIDAGCLDTAGHHTMPAYTFCRERVKRRIWAIIGRDGKRPVWPRRPSRNNKGKVNLFTVGVDSAKESIYGRLRSVTEPGPGYIHFPMDRDAQYFDQLTAERMRPKVHRGFTTYYWWKPEGRRNEALDCRVYAYAALHGLLAMGLRLNHRVTVVEAARAAGDDLLPDPNLPKPQPPAGGRRRRAVQSDYM